MNFSCCTRSQNSVQKAELWKCENVKMSVFFPWFSPTTPNLLSDVACLDAVTCNLNNNLIQFRNVICESHHQKKSHKLFIAEGHLSCFSRYQQQHFQSKYGHQTPLSTRKLFALAINLKSHYKSRLAEFWSPILWVLS